MMAVMRSISPPITRDCSAEHGRASCVRMIASGVFRPCARLPSEIAIARQTIALTNEQRVEIGGHTTQLARIAAAQRLARALFAPR